MKETFFFCVHASGAYTLYKVLVKSILAATHRNCEVKVISSDKVRFAVYEDREKLKLYLLNTDMNVPQTAKILYRGSIIEKSIPSCGLNTVILSKGIT